MRYLLLALGLGVVVWLAWLQRRQSWLYGPYRTDHLKQWAESDPVIPLLPLPEVKPLRGQRVETTRSTVSEFRKRRARR